ncbi:MAG TPA: thiamine phosphate synthase [Longimicrobiaceae bacterium]|jgi:thiamine-phosphate pyrophosphorylase|nr:thiamine phosphate synthase [Longimicrobiaceae bacterium]
MTLPHDLAARLRLIVVTDEGLTAGRDLVEIVRAVLRGGAPAIQLRDKLRTPRESVEMARALLTETRAAGALLFVNDRVDVALAAGADGAHLGDDDLPLPAARRIVPPGFLLGRSADTPDLALAAEREGADYVGVGPVYGTATKADAGAPIGPARIAEVASAVRIPIIGIGGITAANASLVIAAGAAGVAVVSAIMSAPDPEQATRSLLARITSSI